MSRIGKLPIKIPADVTISINDESINVSGPKGSLNQFRLAGISFDQQAETLIVQRENDSRELRSRHGLMRSLVNNMVIGVTTGFVKKLEINGVGYRANMEGNQLRLALGFSHPVNYSVPTDINITVEQNIITIAGISKQQVGQVAAEIRALKKPEPYKGKGIKYSDEHIIRKSGKSGKEK